MREALAVHGQVERERKNKKKRSRNLGTAVEEPRRPQGKERSVGEESLDVDQRFTDPPPRDYRERSSSGQGVSGNIAGIVYRQDRGDKKPRRNTQKQFPGSDRAVMNKNCEA